MQNSSWKHHRHTGFSSRPANPALPSQSVLKRYIHAPSCGAWLSWEVSFPHPSGSLILFCCSCHRSGSCCTGDSITITNTHIELRSRFQPSVLQTLRNENNLCNLNKINPRGSGCLFLACKHHHPGLLTNDKLNSWTVCTFVSCTEGLRSWTGTGEREKQTSPAWGFCFQPPGPARSC